MKFQVISTHEALRPFIHNYWHLHAMATDEGSQRIMANGRVALQFYRAQPISFADDPRLFTCSLNATNQFCRRPTPLYLQPERSRHTVY